MAIFNLEASNIIDLQLKLDGKLPVNRDELLALVNSWGRNQGFYTFDKNGDEIEIKPCKPNKCYDLSNLDVSKISNFDAVFKYSNYNGDINSWDVSKATSMKFMFSYTKEFNQPLDKWNTSKVEDMSFMFYGTKKFNKNINSWNMSRVINIDYMFDGANSFNQPFLLDISHIEDCFFVLDNTISFMNKFNNGKELPSGTTKIKEWLIKNQDRMIAFDIENSKGKELDNFLENFNIIDSANLNELHDVIDSANLNELHNNMEIDNVNI